MSPTLILDYIRLVSYSMVALASIFSVRRKVWPLPLIIGDILIASTYALSILGLRIVGYQESADHFAMIVTPVSVLWAILHFISFLGGDNGDSQSARPKMGKH